MATNLEALVRLRLAGYAAAANVVNGRARPWPLVAAFDVLAVVLMLGALRAAGTFVGHPEPSLIDDVDRSGKGDHGLIASGVPLPVLAPRGASIVTAMADPALLFAPPADAGFLVPSDTAQSRLSAPTDGPSPNDTANPTGAVVTASDGTPTPAATPNAPLERVPPVAKIASIAMRGRAVAAQLASRVVAPVIDAADDSLDRLLLRTEPVTSLDATANVAASANAGVGMTGAVGGAATVVANVAAAAPVQQITQPPTQVVGRVTGLLN